MSSTFIHLINPGVLIALLGFWLNYRTYMRATEDRKKQPISVSDLLKIIESEALLQHHEAAHYELERALKPIDIRYKIKDLSFPEPVKDALTKEYDLVKKIRDAPGQIYFHDRNGIFMRVNFMEFLALALPVCAIIAGAYPFITDADNPKFWGDAMDWTTALMCIILGCGGAIQFYNNQKPKFIYEYHFIDALETLTDKQISSRLPWLRFVYTQGKKLALKQMEKESSLGKATTSL